MSHEPTTVHARLRRGICDDRCHVRDARSGCDCAEAADLINALVAALDRWEAAYQTGRHEPLVIAHEAATAVLARAKGESNEPL